MRIFYYYKGWGESLLSASTFKNIDMLLQYLPVRKSKISKISKAIPATGRGGL
jgi:hypothetical protein